MLELASRVLAVGKTSRLYERLVYRDQIATSVSASVDAREIASQFRIEATARPGGDLAAVERAVDEELERFLLHGPTPAELERVRTGFVADFVRGIERIGGFGGKSDILASQEVFAGDPDGYKATLRRVVEATVESVRDEARAWLSDGVFALEVHPLPEMRPSGEPADRSRMPQPGTPSDPRFPKLERATLANGLRVVLAERHAVPVVELALLVDAGFASDQLAFPGTATLAMGMLDEGTARRSSLGISEELANLAAELETGSNLDVSTVTLSALTRNLDASLELFADVVRNPSFPETELARLRKELLASIGREKVGPVSMALRVFPRLLYGAGHAYGNPFTGTGTESTVARITRDDLLAFHRGWFRPANGTIVVAGDTTLDEIVPRLESLFRDWRGGEAPRKDLRPVEPPEASVHLVDRPGSIQSVIIAGQLAPPRANPDEIAIETMNSILGGMFTSRLNMNLREDKHWTYGAGSFLPGARGPRPFLAFAPVQADRTKEAMEEMLKELRGIRGERPITEDELEKAKAQQTLALPGSWETAQSVVGSIAEVLTYSLPEDWYDTYAARVRALTIADVAAAAEEIVRTDRIVWVVVGDRAKIEDGVRSLGFGDVRLLDADGEPVI
jgi:zinc protease